MKKYWRDRDIEFFKMINKFKKEADLNSNIILLKCRRGVRIMYKRKDEGTRIKDK